MHNVVWTAFFGEIPPGHTVDHIAKYGDMMRERSDNRLCNLRVATPCEQRANQRPSAPRRDARHIRVWRSNGQFDKVYASSKSAEQDLGVHAASLRRVAKGVQREASGYKAEFVYSNEAAAIEGEEFRLVRGRRISQFGRMLDPRTGAFAVKPVATEGNDYATTEDTETGQKVLIHHLVAAAFPELVDGEFGRGKTLDHIDRNRNNNSASNLAWKTLHEQSINRVYSCGSRFDARHQVQILDYSLGKWITCLSIDDACKYATGNGVDIKYEALCRGLKVHGYYRVPSGLGFGWMFIVQQRPSTPGNSSSCE
jgi:hypothetical protein